MTTINITRIAHDLADTAVPGELLVSSLEALHVLGAAYTEIIL